MTSNYYRKYHSLMKMGISSLVIRIILGVIGFMIVGYGIPQYHTDADRREYGALLKIKPPADAIELKVERSFPTAEQEEKGQFLSQTGMLAMDALGVFYISDWKDNVVYRYDSAGKYLGQFGRQGQGPGDLYMPKHLQILSDEIAVNELGNRRIQYFNLEGKPLRTVQRPRDYYDLVIMPDGRFVGAVASVESYQNNKLIDFVSSDGKIIRSFGNPVPFKYLQSDMNDRFVLVNANKEIFLLFRFLAIARKYSSDGRLFWEKQVQTPFSPVKDKLNRRGNSYLPDNRPGYYSIITIPRIFEGDFYIVDQVGSRLWIWQMDDNFSIQRTYYAEFGNYFYVSDMIPKMDNGRLKFFILGHLAEEGPQIHVLAPINE